MTYLDILEAQLATDEGRKNFMYTDSVGIPTIGIGHNLKQPISDRAVRVIFEDDVAAAERDTRKLFPNFDQHTDGRKAALLNMTFNLGQSRLSGFTKFRAAIAAYDFERAAVEMLDSTWSKQVGDRATRLADIIRKG